MSPADISGKYVIPDGVTKIGDDAFSGCKSLTEVVIPESVTSIGRHAFEFCSNLLVAEIPDSVKSIGGYAFWYCASLKNIEIPSGITRIEDDAFSGCESLTEVVIPEGVTSIGRSAFSGCENLKSITIPASVTNIECLSYDDYFSGCSSLSNIVVAEENAYYTVENHILFNKEKTELLFAAPAGEIGEYVIPDSVTSIRDSAFQNCKGLTAVEITNSVTEIKDSTFYNCSGLISVVIPASVSSIGRSAFYDCKSLKNITVSEGNKHYTAENNVLFNKNKTELVLATSKGLNGKYVVPDSVTRIYSNAFEGCSGLTSITIPNSVTSIGSSAFSGCSGLRDIELPDGLTSIESSTFYGCLSLSAITIPPSVAKIETYAFYKCENLVSVDIPNGVMSIGDNVFWYCENLISLVIPNSVTSIGRGAFSDCSGLRDIKLPDGLTSIGGNTFSRCSSLSAITIPNSVTEIGSYAFSGCENLQSITVAEGSEYYIAENNVLYDKDKTAVIKAAPLGVTGVFVIPDSVTSIGESAFSDCSGLTSITIPDGVISIGDSAFEDCSGLTSITIPESVTNIDTNAFMSCRNLKQISIPANTTNIGNRVFTYCDSLESITVEPGNPAYMAENNILFSKDKTRLIVAAPAGVTGDYTIPEGVKILERESFVFCKNLTGISIPASMSDISDRVFYNCSSLKSITVDSGNSTYTTENNILFSKDKTRLIVAAPAGVTGDYAIPEGVKTLEREAFYSCESLTGISIPKSVTDISDMTFYICSNLERLTVDAENPAYTAENNVLYNKDKTRLIVAAPAGLAGEYIIPDSVTRIDSDAFYSCNNLTGITIPASVNTIEKYTFTLCKNLEHITVSPENSNFTAENNVLYNKDKTRLMLVAPAGLAGEYIIPDSVISIEANSVRNCTNMTSVVIPTSVTNIGSYAFMGSSALTDVHYAGTQEQWEAIAIAEGNEELMNAAIHFESAGGASGVRDLAAEQITNDRITLRFTPPEDAETLQLEQSVDRRAWTAAQTETPLTPQSGTAVATGLTADTTYYFRLRVTGGEKAGLSNVVQAKTAKYTSEEDFAVEDGTVTDYTGQGTAAVIPPEINGVPVTAVGASAFEGSALTNIVLPDTVVSVGAKAFSKSANLKSITIPYSVTAIASDALEGCNSLTEIVYSGNPEEWELVKAQLGQSIANVQVQFVPNVNTEVSSIGGETTFTVAVRNIPQQSEVILALYKNNQLVDTKTAVYDGQNISFATTVDYDIAKVMAWDSLDAMNPVCEFDMIQGN